VQIRCLDPKGSPPHARTAFVMLDAAANRGVEPPAGFLYHVMPWWRRDRVRTKEVPLRVRVLLAVVAAAVMTSGAASAADYAEVPYRPAYRAPRATYLPPPVGIRPAPPVIWVEAPPQYIQHLVPTRGCGGCTQYAPRGHWDRVAPPNPWDRIYWDYGY